MIDRAYITRQSGSNLREGGYTLIEVLVAAFIVAAGVAAAAILSMTMISQQEASARIIRAINYQEQAVRLYQLGLDAPTITNILPTESAIVSIQVTQQDVALTNIGTVQVSVWSVAYDGGSLLNANTPVVTNDMAAVRPSIR